MNNGIRPWQTSASEISANQVRWCTNTIVQRAPSIQRSNVHFFEVCGHLRYMKHRNWHTYFKHATCNTLARPRSEHSNVKCIVCYLEDGVRASNYLISREFTCWVQLSNDTEIVWCACVVNIEWYCTTAQYCIWNSSDMKRVNIMVTAVSFPHSWVRVRCMPNMLHRLPVRWPSVGWKKTFSATPKVLFIIRLLLFDRIWRRLVSEYLRKHDYALYRLC